jgi:hypothetical protein
MTTDLLDALERNLDSIAYILLVVVLMAVAIHADHRFTQERNRSENLERRIRSLVLVVRFQQSLVDAKLPEPETVTTARGEAEYLDLSVDGLISRLGYCLTCHRLKAPAHFVQTDHLRLEDDNLTGADHERH